VVMRLSGDPVPLLLPPDAPRSEIFRVRRELGLDQPLPVQYGVFLANVLRGDFGRSIHFREPAFSVVRGYLGATVELGLTSFLLAAIVAVPVGLLSAVKRNSPIDHAAMGVALVGQSAPTFFLGILFILLLSLKADLFPTGGRGDWTHLVLPALTLGAFAMASIARLTRSAVLEVLRADYIRTARAKGVAEWLVVVKHTLKTAALPMVRIPGLPFGTPLGGAAPWLAPHDPTRQALRGRLTAPTLAAADGRARLLGTDHLGRDVLSRVIYGARVSLVVGVAAVVVGGALGAALGIAAGFRGGFTDSVIMTLADAQLAFPFILLAIGIIAVLGPSFPTPTPSWGGMVHEGREYLDSAWWISTFPGLVLMLTSIVVSRTGDWLRDLLDPTLRGE